MRLDDVLKNKGSEPEKEDSNSPGSSTPAMPEPAAPAPPVKVPPVVHAASSQGKGAGRPVVTEREPTKPVFSTLGWQSVGPAPVRRRLWQELPSLNRGFTTIGAACLFLALARTAGPPAVAKVQGAVRPYTATGKQELCLTNLRSIAQAMAAYAQDNDGRFPPLDYQKNKNQRVTWVSLLSGRTEDHQWQCPVGPRVAAGSDSEMLLSSYAMNPVAATAKASELDNPSASLLVADGGGKHDVSLLPPYPTWPSFAARQPNGGLAAAECNLDQRHAGKAVLVYADGHADAVSDGSWIADPAAWGGSAVLRRARTRLGERGPQARELLKRVRAGDVKGAASYLSANRAALKPIVLDMTALWRMNGDGGLSDSLEENGWNLAKAAGLAGDGSLLAQCNEEQTRRSQAGVQTVNGGAWEQNDMMSNPGIRCQRPSVWKYQQESQGRYYRAYIRSSSPSVFALLEVGQRQAYITPQPIDWHGSENDLRSRYGSQGYKRLGLNRVTMWGMNASEWEYELEKPGGPRLRKRYRGYTDGNASYVIGFTAPVKDWALWQPTFDKILKSAEHTSSGGE